MVAAAQESPFVGAWVSTDTDGSPRTMYIDQWGPDTYQVRVRGEAASVCEGVGRLATDTSLVVARLESSTQHVSSCDGTAEVITFAVLTTQDEFEDAIAELAPIIDSVEFHLGCSPGRAEPVRNTARLSGRRDR